MSYQIVSNQAAFTLREGEFQWQPTIAFLQIVRGWSQTPGVNGVRFLQPLFLTDTTGLLFFNERAQVLDGLGNDTNNDGEDGLRISCCDFAIDIGAQTITTGPNRIVYEPPGWATATGSAYCPQPLRLPNGKIIVAFNLLRSATGKNNAVPAYLDFYVTDSDDDGVTWPADPLLIKTAESFYTDNGLPLAGGSGVGLYCNGTNNIVLMERGRIVLAGQANSASGPNYLGSIRTDDIETGLTDWTWGTPLQVDPVHAYNEQALTSWFGDTLRSFGRAAGGNGRGEFSSGDGDLWAYEGWRPDIPIQDVNCSAWRAGDRVYVGGATDVHAGYRDQFKIFLLNGASVVTATLDGLVPDVLRLGYCAGASRNGLNLLAGEMSSGAKDTSFNAQPSGFVAVFNDPAADHNFPVLRASDATLYPQGPDALFDAYKAWVEGDDATIFDEAACRAAFARAYAGNYLSIAAAFSPRWGWKGTGAADTVLYDIGPRRLKTSSVGISASMTFHTTLGPRTLSIPNADAFLKVDLPLRVGATMGMMIVDLAAPMDGTGSVGIQFTKGVVHTMMPGHGIFTIGAEYRLESNPEYPTAAADAVHIFADFGRSYALMGVNGVNEKAQPYIPTTHFAAGEVGTISITVTASEGTPREPVELWFFDDGPLEPMRQAGEDAGAIY